MSTRASFIGKGTVAALTESTAAMHIYKPKSWSYGKRTRFSTGVSKQSTTTISASNYPQKNTKTARQTETQRTKTPEGIQRAFRCTQVEGKGIGVKSTRPIAPGTLIMVEQPLVRVDHEWYHVSDVEAAYSTASARAQVEFDALHSVHDLRLEFPYIDTPWRKFEGLRQSSDKEAQQPDVQRHTRHINREEIDEQDSKTDEVKHVIQVWKARTSHGQSIFSIFLANAMEVGDGAAVFQMASRLNHSCCPNAIYSWDGNKMRIFAIKHIAADEVSPSPSV